jgi:tRNA modification GTPase
VSNLRHASLLETSAAALTRAENAAARLNAPEEFILSDLQVAQNALEEMTGRRAGDDLLHHIFERFCVGK